MKNNVILKQLEEANNQSRRKIRLGFYPYTYVRTNVMRTLLLKKEDYHKLLKMTFSEITRFLQDSVYKKEIDSLATQYSGADLLEIALNANLRASFGKLRRISSEELVLLIDEYLKRKDIEDFKTVLRGKYTKAGDAIIKSALQGAGTLSLDFFYNLLKTDSIEETLRSLEIIDFRYLERAYLEFKEKNTLAPIENALDIFYYDEILDFAKRLPKEGTLFKDFLIKEIEVRNLLAILRLKKEKMPKAEIKRYLFFAGKKEEEMFEKLLNTGDFNEIAVKLEKRDYGSIVKKGIESFVKNNSLIEMEIGLYKYLLNKSILMLHQNILSVDVILGYMFAKEIEIRNLKILIKGKQLGLDEEFVESQLVI